MASQTLLLTFLSGAGLMASIFAFQDYRHYHESTDLRYGVLLSAVAVIELFLAWSLP